MLPEEQLRLSAYQTACFQACTRLHGLGLIHSCPRCLQKRSLVYRKSPCKMGLLVTLSGCVVSYHTLSYHTSAPLKAVTVEHAGWRAAPPVDSLSDMQTALHRGQVCTAPAVARVEQPAISGPVPTPVSAIGGLPPL